MKKVDKKYKPYKKKYLSDYFIKNTSFYYNFDISMLELISDLLKRYWKITKKIIDYKNGEREKENAIIIKKAIKNFKKYKKYDWVDNTTDKYRANALKSLKELADIWPSLWY